MRQHPVDEKAPSDEVVPLVKRYIGVKKHPSREAILLGKSDPLGENTILDEVAALSEVAPVAEEAPMGKATPVCKCCTIVPQEE